MGRDRLYKLNCLPGGSPLNPKYTSKDVANVDIEKENRINQSQFRCLACGFVDKADTGGEKPLVSLR